jgi:hypothetical protein
MSGAAAGGTAGAENVLTGGASQIIPAAINAANSLSNTASQNGINAGDQGMLTGGLSGLKQGGTSGVADVLTGGLSGELQQTFQGVGANTGPTNPGLNTTSQGVVGGINNFLGTSNNFQGVAAPIQQGTNASQLSTAYGGTQSGLTQQQSLVNANTTGVNQGLGTQNTLAQNLANEAAGQGPNPAQAALNQSTQANISQQAALAAGQRGAGANAGLLAAGNAQQGAATQQQAVGQAATLQAQQQLAAQQQQAALASTQVNQGANAITGLNTAQQNEQNILQNANTSANNAGVAMQGNINNVNAAVSEGNQQQAANTVGGITSGLSSVLGGGSSMLSSLFAAGGPVTAPPPNPTPTPTPTPGPIDPDTAKSFSKGLLGYDEGGEVDEGDYTSSSASSGPSIAAASAAPSGGANYGQDTNGGKSGGSGGGGGGAAGLLALLAEGGYVEKYLNRAKGGKVPPPAGKQVPAMVSPGERYLSPSDVKKVMAGKANPMQVGTTIPGKAVVKDDSLKNDTVKKTLQAGGLVIPRHITEHPMAHEKALSFIHASMAKKGMVRK